MIAPGLLTIFALTAALDFLDIRAGELPDRRRVLLAFPAWRLVEHGYPAASGERMNRERTATDHCGLPLRPVLAGPGALDTATSFAGRFNEGIAIGAAAAVLGLAFTFFAASAAISAWVHPNLLRAAARIVGVLLMAIAADFVVTGVQAL